MLDKPIGNYYLCITDKCNCTYNEENIEHCRQMPISIIVIILFLQHAYKCYDGKISKTWRI